MNVLIKFSSNRLSCNRVLFDALLRCMYITSLMQVLSVILRPVASASIRDHGEQSNLSYDVHDARSRGVVVAAGCENSAINGNIAQTQTRGDFADGWMISLAGAPAPCRLCSLRQEQRRQGHRMVMAIMGQTVCTPWAIHSLLLLI